jgi:hypothetical protein
MMQKIKLDKTWQVLRGQIMGNLKYWAEIHKIPLGSLKPYFSYPKIGDSHSIPESDIVTIDFDPANIPPASRNALNILFLGASGDGKSLQLKIIWSVLHDAGYFVGYVDPIKTQAGRAKIKWEGSNRLPPNMIAHGIPLQHFMPSWAMRKFDHMKHNFREYSIRLHKMDEVEKWQGLGMSFPGASKVTEIINKYGRSITFRDLRSELFELDKEEISSVTYDSVMRILSICEVYKVVVDDGKELNLWNEWNKGFSVVLSYNNASAQHMTFDIGFNISESASYNALKNNQTPIMWILDDSSLYANEFNIVKFNYAVQEIKNIGYNYRGLGLNNCLAVQSLAIIDDAIAETYKIKIISPKFANVDSLLKINIPRKAIDMLKNNELVIDRKNNLLQFLLIDPNNEVVPYFPFTPPANHFSEIYHSRNLYQQKIKESEAV